MLRLFSLSVLGYTFFASLDHQVPVLTRLDMYPTRTWWGQASIIDMAMKSLTSGFVHKTKNKATSTMCEKTLAAPHPSSEVTRFSYEYTVSGTIVRLGWGSSAMLQFLVFSNPPYSSRSKSNSSRSNSKSSRSNSKSSSSNSKSSSSSNNNSSKEAAMANQTEPCVKNCTSLLPTSWTCISFCTIWLRRCPICRPN